MVFSSYSFLFIFLPIFFICYFLFNKNFVLVIFSVLFYAVGEPRYIFLLIISTFINHLFGLHITNNKKLFIISIVFNVLILFTFKYFNLFFNSFVAFLNTTFSTNITLKSSIPLPIGISFYTFQSISYLVDVYMKKVNCQKYYYKTLLYISMFPQLIAGPIVRYNQIATEIDNRESSYEKIFEGSIRAIIGLSKKVIIADNLSYLVQYFLQVNNQSFTKLGGILGIIFYAIQLYYDFSGYSDIAIGLGKIIGFDFEENFSYPFMSKNLSEFWRHWHISLSTWFKDYLFYPILLSKKIKKIRNKLNKINKKFSTLVVDIIALFIVWFTTGVWHGASLNYFLWGLYLGIVMSIEHIFMTCIKIRKKILISPIVKIINRLYFFVIIFFSFTIFYFENINDLKIFFLNLLNHNIPLSNLMVNQYVKNNVFLIIVSLLFLFPIYNNIESLFKNISDNKVISSFYIDKVKNFLLCSVCIILLIISTLFIISTTNSPFLYMRF